MRRRRGVLARELAAIDRLVGRLAEDAPALAISERRAHVRALLLSGRVTEPQFVILERRLDEAGGGRAAHVTVR